MEPNAQAYTACTVLYGDNTLYAVRCVSSLLKLRLLGAQLRIGLNEACGATRSYLSGLIRAEQLTPEEIYDSGRNAHKYPLMRYMFDGDHPIDTPFVIWADDDSFVRQAGPLIRHLNSLFKMEHVGLLGREYLYRQLRPEQIAWIRAQPWYNGRDLARPKIRFMPGAFWAARMDIVRRLGFPWKELDHCGGDIAFSIAVGELCAAVIGINRDLVGFNASLEAPEKESSASRRGTSQRPLGLYPDHVDPQPVTSIIPFRDHESHTL
jgi:hypothetical protein